MYLLKLCTISWKVDRLIDANLCLNADLPQAYVKYSAQSFSEPSASSLLHNIRGQSGGEVSESL
jgi:hypothetical protein